MLNVVVAKIANMMGQDSTTIRDPMLETRMSQGPSLPHVLTRG